jgi:hypothetical protein
VSDPLDDDGEKRDAAAREARLLEAMDDDAKVANLARLLKDEGMRDFLWEILTHCGIYRSTYNRNMGDMSLAEGIRSVGLWLLSQVAEADPFAESVMKQKANLLAQQERVRSRKRKS